VLRANQRREFGENQLGHGFQVTLALEQPGEAREIGLEPILFGVFSVVSRRFRII
jgi:hypothetical protein